MICPVCGNDTFDENSYEYDICPECFWEYDLFQVEEPDYPGGANHHSLIEYKKIYWRLKEQNPQFSCRNDADCDLIIKLDHED